MANQIYVDPREVDVPEFEHLSDSELIALADSPEKEAEFQRRLGLTPVVNRLAFRFVAMWSRKHVRPLTVEEEAAFYDAFVGLRACCYKAKRNLWAPRDVGDTALEATLRFFEDRIFELLAPYLIQSQSKGLQVLALFGEFKNIPRETYFDLLDCIRKKYTEKSVQFVPLEEAASVEDPHSCPGRSDVSHIEEAVAILNIQKAELIRQLGEEDWTTLRIAVAFALRSKDMDSRQERKGALTREIARTLGVEVRQASHRKQSMQDKMLKALKCGSQAVSRIYSCLSEATRT